MSIFQASPQSQWALGFLRIVVGLLFMAEGTMKWFGFPPPPGPMPPITLMSLAGAAGLIEMTGGFLITIGLLTRPVAFILSGEMAIAYFHAHFPQAFFPMTNNGMPAVLFCFMFLYFSFAGAGAWGVDNLFATAWDRREHDAHDPWLPGIPGGRTVRPIRVRRR